MAMTSRTVHKKCRSLFYPTGNIKRLLLNDSQVPWNVDILYEPGEYESPSLKNKPWADPYIGDENFRPNFNAIDGNIDRRSHTGAYSIINGRPLNPEGRTGLAGRGLLGRWGPNHAADPIVTRWKVSEGKRQFHPESQLPILQFCGIQRHDCNEWAIPGGMVDPGENVSETLKREFLEEAFDSLGSSPETVNKNRSLIMEFFKSGHDIYKGYVDDPRNTDNAWMETVAVNFHDDSGNVVGNFKLKAGDDAKNVSWINAGSDLKLYASHLTFIQRVVKLHGAHW